MATPKGCSMCEKGTGTYFCTGCQAYFCMKHLKIHHEQLLTQLDVLVEERNGLQQDIGSLTEPKDFRSPLLDQINEWQNVTVEKVKQAAEKARRQVIELLSVERKSIKTQFDELSKELVRLKETEDFAENDLDGLKKTMRSLKLDLQHLTQPLAAELNIEQSTKIVWDRLIYIEKKSNTKQQQQATSKFFFSVLI